MLWRCQLITDKVDTEYIIRKYKYVYIYISTFDSKFPKILPNQ